MNRATVRLLLVFLLVLVGSGLFVYLVLDRTQPNRATSVDRPAAAESAQSTEPSNAPPAGSNSILTDLFGPDYATPQAPENIIASRIFIRFLIAAVLSTFLAFRWRKGIGMAKRNPYVAQTQILLAVVAAAMMMVVGDSAARAFGIFAAASLVRFRTNIRDPKETTVLLICLGVGLACGVGRLDMAAILTVFVLLSLWIMEYFERAQVFRSMELSVGTRNLDRTLSVLQSIFASHGFGSELRQMHRQTSDEEPSKLVFELSMGAVTSTDRLTEEMLAEDAENISTIEWDQKKSTTYIYR